MIDTIKKILKLAFSISILIFIYLFGYKYIIGFLMGMILMSFLFLFPSPFGLRMMDSLFGYSEKISVVMKNESEEQDKKIREIKSSRSVKYKNS